MPTIGIETHVQLKTKSKLFSGAGNDARGAEPNTLINHVDFGLPGALPVLNQEAIKLACKVAMALKTKPRLFSTFDRKHYFYPDLPMGYQITQYDQPIIIGGQVEFELDSKPKRVGITRAHLEADAGKSTHPAGKDYSLVDLNRAGTPLIEIVSEPDMHSSAEAKAYAYELYLLMCYASVTDGDLYHGNMRFDVNVSVSNNDILGVRSETKNLNSFRAVEKAVDYEIKRQIELIKRGQPIIQETRGWNEAKQITTSLRFKENADDYRYMPDPDLPPIVIDENYVNKVAETLPKLPDFWRSKLFKLGLSKMQIAVLLDANIDFSDCGYLDLIADFANSNLDVKSLTNWLINVDIPLNRESKTQPNIIRFSLYESVIRLIESGKLNSTSAKELVARLLSSEKLPSNIERFAKTSGLLQTNDTDEIETLVDQVIKANPKAVKDVLGGEDKAVGYLIGQVMASSHGQANPEVARTLIMHKLEP
jgi:aspartyl-tRNA(Asn)/glutamyl-tRNA(Gln) amidotransferase subunit B